MGGNARKKRMIAAVRANAKGKEAEKKSGPSTKVVEPTTEKKIIPRERIEPERPRSSWTGKTPIDLLREHLQRNGWSRMKWNDQGTGQDQRGKAKFSWKLNLFHPKTEERLFFRTCEYADQIDPGDKTEQTWEWKFGAKNNCALAALIHFLPKQTLHLHIGPEFRPLWFHLHDKHQKKEVQTQQREEKREKREEKQKFFDSLEQKNQLTRMQISMTEKTRKLCNEIFDGLADPHQGQPIAIPKLVSSNLRKKGFTASQIKEYQKYALLSTCQTPKEQEELLFEALLLHVPENELPVLYKPSSGNFEVVDLTNSKNSKKEETRISLEALDESSRFKMEQIQSLGFTTKQVLPLAIVNRSFNIYDTCLQLYSQYVLMNCEALQGNDEKISKSDLLDLRTEEEETLSAMFDNEFTKESMALGKEIVTIWRLPIRLEGKRNLAGSLVIFFPSSSTYPHTVPWLNIEVAGLSCEDSQKIIRRLFFCFHDPQESNLDSQIVSPCTLMQSLGEMPMIFSIVMWIQENGEISLQHKDPVVSSHSSAKKIEKNQEKELLKVPKKQQQKKKEEYSQYLAPPRTAAQVKAISKKNYEEQEARKNAPALQEMTELRKKLPADKFRQQIVELYNTHDVLVISGETGCGKTTQIPQFLLEYAIQQQSAGQCNMICTQPRRLSAIGVASRVAKERNENMEESRSLVGYQVRLQKQISKSCRLVFCTIGILLRRLQQLAQASQEKQAKTKKKSNLMHEYLSSLSCIIIDEVHERSLDCDFLLILLKQFMLHRPAPSAACPPLKIILMSATISTSSFLEYFQAKNLKVTSFHIPGFTYPVTQYFLPSIMKKVRYNIPEHKAKKPKNYDTLLSHLHSEIPDASPELLHTLGVFNYSKIDFGLIEKLIIHLIHEENEKHGLLSGSILVFLPGIAEISKLRDIVSSSSISNDSIVIALHSSIPLDKQQQVFDPAPPGKIKVVLSTNIAETSVTIPDVVFVIDTGKSKQMEYDAETQISALRETFISRSSANQRSGRAGRVRKGNCYKLYTETFYKEKMQSFDTPEIFRVPLHQVYLLTCLFLTSNSLVSVDRVNRFLSSAIESPSVEQLDGARNYLTDVGALRMISEGNLYLTPLGVHITKLPMDVRMAKLLIFSAILRCVNPILTICAVLSYQSPFMSPIEHRNEATEAQKKFRKCKSDHISYYYAYEAFLQAKKEGKAHQFCTKHFLSSSTMYMIGKLRKQFIELLADIGFISYNKRSQKIDEFANEQQNNLKILQACLCAGLYPNVMKIQPPVKEYAKVAAGGTVERSIKVQQLKFYTKDKKRIFIHPGSFNFKETSYESVWMVFLRIMETSRVFVRDTTMVYPYPLLLFGSHDIRIDQEKKLIVADDWMYFEADIRVGIIIRKLREELDKLLEKHIRLPHFELDDPLFELIIKIIRSNGLM